MVEWRDGSRKLAVKATDSRWLEKGFDFMDIDTIQPVSVDFNRPLMPKLAGSDNFRVRVWKKKGVRGDQAGPNSGGPQLVIFDPPPPPFASGLEVY